MSHAHTNSIPLNMDTTASSSEDLSDRLELSVEEKEAEAKNDLPTTGLLDTKATNPETSGRTGAVIVHQATWYFGWKTVATMTICYLIALISALFHFFLFRWLNGQPVGNDSGVTTQICLLSRRFCHGQRTDQVYITTASVILTDVFGFCINVSLTTAFVQCLWEKLRKSALSVDTIESLFLMRSNALHFFNFSVWRKATILVLVALSSYFISLATSFAPGALTIKSMSSPTTVSADILTFNASDTGDGTMMSAMESSFGLTNYVNISDSTLLLYTSFWTPPAPLARLATRTSMDGKPLSIPSPCGPNCTYTYEFEGPTFNCFSTTTNGTWKPARGISDVSRPIYTGSWNYFLKEDSDMSLNGVYAAGSSPPENVKPYLNITTINLQPVTYRWDDLYKYYNASVAYTETSLTCLPYRSLYTVTNSYTNNIQTLNYSTTELEELPRLDGFEYGINMTTNPTSMTDKNLLNDIILNWTDESRLWYRNTQMMGIITGATAVLNGTCLSQAEFTVPTTSTTSSSIDVQLHWSTTDIQSTGLGGPILPYTQLSLAFNDWTIKDIYSTNSALSFEITESAINKLLGDYVISIAPAFSAWNQTIKVIESPALNIYSFSRQEHLIIPYTTWLIITLPVLLWGIFSLRRNGVPANDGGFIQILCTTTASLALRVAAAGHCLGGDGNFSRKLRDLEVRFGEMVGREVEVEGVRVRRAGFGTEDEVGELVKGEVYGVVEEI